MEVIARKQVGLTTAYFICWAPWAFLFVASTISLVAGCINNDPWGVLVGSICMIIFPGPTIMFSIGLWKNLMVPKLIITYENGILKYKKIEFTASQIYYVDYKLDYMFKGGKLILYVDNKKFVISGVANVGDVCRRLYQLKYEQENKGI